MLGRRTLLAAGGSAVALGLYGPGAVAQGTTLNVGAAKYEIATPAGIQSYSTVIDPLYVRVLLLKSGARVISLVSLDLTSLDVLLVEHWQAVVAGILGSASSDVLVYAAHNFSSPHVWSPPDAPSFVDLPSNAAFITAIDDALKQAVTAAVAAMVPARVGHGTGALHVATNRNELSSSGWWIGFNDTLFSDPLFSVLRFDDAAGKPIAILANAAVQPSVLMAVNDANGNPVLSADLAGSVCSRLEAYYGSGVTALFMPGAGGDQSPIFKGVFNIFPPSGEILTISQTQDQATALLDQIGGRLTADIVRVVDQINTTSTQRLVLENTSVQVLSVTSYTLSAQAPVTTLPYTLGPAVDIPCALLVIGDAVIVGTTPELSAALGVAIRNASPFKGTLVATLVGPAAKYLPTFKQYEQFTYEAQEAEYAPGSGELFVEAVGRKLGNLGRVSF